MHEVLARERVNPKVLKLKLCVGVEVPPLSSALRTLQKHINTDFSPEIYKKRPKISESDGKIGPYLFGRTGNAQGFIGYL